MKNKQKKDSCYWIRRYHTYKNKHGKRKALRSLKNGKINSDYQNSWTKKMYGCPNINSYFKIKNYGL
jgi:hypothetical protein